MFESQKPKRGPLHETWSFLKIERGGELRAYKAGPLVGVWVHHAEASKPCREILTAGELTCPWHDGPRRLQWVGYIPLYTHEGGRVVVIVKTDNVDEANMIGMHRPVIARRLDHYHASVTVSPSEWTQQSYRRGQTSPPLVDLKPWLLRVWGDKALREWAAARAAAKALSDSAERATIGLDAATQAVNGDAVKSSDEVLRQYRRRMRFGGFDPNGDAKSA